MSPREHVNARSQSISDLGAQNTMPSLPILILSELEGESKLPPARKMWFPTTLLASPEQTLEFAKASLGEYAVSAHLNPHRH